MKRELRAAYREAGHPPWQWMLALSLAFHMLGIAGILALERFVPKRTPDLSAISVRLVGAVPGASLAQASPQGAQSPPAQSKPSSSEERPMPKKIPIPVPQSEKKAVSVQPTEVKVPERIKPEPLPEPKGSKGSKATEQAQGTASQGSSVGPKVAALEQGGGGGGRLTPEEARYLQMLQERVEESWRAYVHGDEGGVLGEVRVQISRDGKIKEFSFIKGSGKHHVDSSIVSALNKVVLPPPPPSLVDKPLILRFWPSGPASRAS